MRCCYFADNPVLFVILSGLVFFAWGEIYSLFPATCTDIYGRKFATTNYGMLYTAKGTAALLVPLGNVLTSATGSWHAVFYVAAILNIVAAVMALAGAEADATARHGCCLTVRSDASALLSRGRASRLRHRPARLRRR